MQQPYTVYEVLPDGRGRIVKSGTCQPGMMRDQIDDPATQIVVEGEYSPDTHYVRAGFMTRRPSIGVAEPFGATGFYFSSPPPEGLVVTIVIEDDEYDDVALDGYTVGFPVCPRGKITLRAEWPYLDQDVYLTDEAAAIPGDAQIVLPDVDRMRARYIQDVSDRSEQSRRALLGEPTPAQIEQWKVSRALFEASKAQALSAGDQSAIAAACHYTGQTEAEYLASVAQEAEFENWVTMRTSGLRSEVIRRLNAVTDPAGFQSVIDWALAEEAAGMAEAVAMRAG